MKRPINERAAPLNEQQINEAGRYLLDILNTFKRTGRQTLDDHLPKNRDLKGDNEPAAL